MHKLFLRQVVVCLSGFKYKSLSDANQLLQNWTTINWAQLKYSKKRLLFPLLLLVIKQKSHRWSTFKFSQFFRRNYGLPRTKLCRQALSSYKLSVDGDRWFSAVIKGAKVLANTEKLFTWYCENLRLKVFKATSFNLCTEISKINTLDVVTY